MTEPVEALFMGFGVLGLPAVLVVDSFDSNLPSAAGHSLRSGENIASGKRWLMTGKNANQIRFRATSAACGTLAVLQRAGLGGKQTRVSKRDP